LGPPLPHTQCRVPASPKHTSITTTVPCTPAIHMPPFTHITLHLHGLVLYPFTHHWTCLALLPRPLFLTLVPFGHLNTYTLLSLERPWTLHTVFLGSHTLGWGSTFTCYHLFSRPAHSYHPPHCLVSSCHQFLPAGFCLPVSPPPCPAGATPAWSGGHTRDLPTPAQYCRATITHPPPSPVPFLACYHLPGTTGSCLLPLLPLVTGLDNLPPPAHHNTFPTFWSAIYLGVPHHPTQFPLHRPVPPPYSGPTLGSCTDSSLPATPTPGSSSIFAIQHCHHWVLFLSSMPWFILLFLPFSYITFSSPSYLPSSFNLRRLCTAIVPPVPPFCLALYLCSSIILEWTVIPTSHALPHHLLRVDHLPVPTLPGSTTPCPRLPPLHSYYHQLHLGSATCPTPFQFTCATHAMCPTPGACQFFCRATRLVCAATPVPACRPLPARLPPLCLHTRCLCLLHICLSLPHPSLELPTALPPYRLPPVPPPTLAPS